MELTDEEYFEQEMEAEARDAREAEKQKIITVEYIVGEGLENLVPDPMKPGHLIWIPF